MQAPPDVVIVTGTTPHTDAWHDLAATSAALASALALEGFTRIRHTSTAEPSDLTAARLVVVNASGETHAPSDDASRVVDAVWNAHTAGVPLLAVHSSIFAFGADPRWAGLLGGRWVPGVSHHPPHGRAIVELVGPHGGSFTVLDERYTDLEVQPDAPIVATHHDGGARHPLVWVRDDGTARVAYSALGHDARSYTSTGHRMLLARLVSWLLHGVP